MEIICCLTQNKEQNNSMQRVIPFRAKRKMHLHKIKCNLCEEEFMPHSKFDRFCDKCKSENECYHFGEWLSA